jgi:hypothetical protein
VVVVSPKIATRSNGTRCGKGVEVAVNVGGTVAVAVAGATVGSGSGVAAAQAVNKNAASVSEQRKYRIAKIYGAQVVW